MYNVQYGGYGNEEYGEYGEEEEKKAIIKPKKGKKPKRDQGLGAYEEDLGEKSDNDKDDEMEQIMELSKSTANNKKAKLKNFEEPEEIVVISIAEQFKDFFTPV